MTRNLFFAKNGQLLSLLGTREKCKKILKKLFGLLELEMADLRSF
jgi:hypothetical protein